MFLHVKQSDCKAAVKVVSGIWLKVCVQSSNLEMSSISIWKKSFFLQIVPGTSVGQAMTQLFYVYDHKLFQRKLKKRQVPR